MTTLDDLVPLGGDRLMDLSGWKGKDGATWDWTFQLFDDAGAVVDCSGWTGTAKVRDKIDGTQLVAFTVTCSSTSVRLVAAASATNGINSPDSANPVRRACVWSCRLTKGATTIDLFGPDEFVAMSDLGWS